MSIYFINNNKKYDKILKDKNFLKCKDEYDVINKMSDKDILIIIVSSIDKVLNEQLKYFKEKKYNMYLIFEEKLPFIDFIEIMKNFFYLKGIHYLDHFLKIKDTINFFENLLINEIIYLPIESYNYLIREHKSESLKNLYLSKLSDKEKIVFSMLIYSNLEIAEKLRVQEGTIKKHVSSILKKTNCKNRIELLSKI